jgi:hypothetical protein
MAGLKPMIDDKIDVSDVPEEHRSYLRAYFASALKDRPFRSCKVTYLHPGERRISFQLVFEDGSRSEAEDVPAEVAFERDRNDQVVYDDETGARRTVLGFVPNGVLEGMVASLFARRNPG